MPVVDTTQSFATGDTVTSTTLNNIMDQSIFVAGAVVSGSGLDITAGGQMTISDNGVPGSKITNGTITSSKIEDGAIVNADINASAAIDPSKLGSGALPVSATVTTANIVDASITAPKLSGAQTGTAPIFAARAWVSFDATVTANIVGTASRGSGSTTVTIALVNHGLLTGHKVFIDFTSIIVDGAYVVTKVNDDTFTITTAASTPASGISATVSKLTIRSSGNVSCVSRSSAGNFLVNFTSFMSTQNNYTGVFNGLRYSFFDRSGSDYGYALVQADNGDGVGADYNTNNAIFFE